MKMLAKDSAIFVPMAVPWTWRHAPLKRRVFLENDATQTPLDANRMVQSSNTYGGSNVNVQVLF